LTGLHFENNPTKALSDIESDINPVIKGYDWSNMAAVEHSKDNGCPSYCPVATYDIVAYKSSLETD